MTDPAFPAAAFAPAERITLQATPLAVIREEGLRVADLGAVFDRGYTAIGGLFQSGELVPTGPALAIYHGDPMGEFDLELGFPVTVAPAAPIVRGDVVVRASQLPAGPAFATTHIGPYDGLGGAWGELAGAADGTPTGVWIESYVGEPGSTAPEELRTDLILPVRD